MLTTKLHRPPLSAEHVFRYRLIDELNRNIYKPLSLICAPAGYGKSMLASSWIEESNIQSAWLSLSEDDNDLFTFLNYFVIAIQKIFPGKLSKTQAILNAQELGKEILISHTLINELDQIQEPFILVLDDYHLIHSNDIHQQIDELLRYPPENLHLCILTRRDPPLRIASLRSHNRMTEIRMDDLGFLEDEVLSLFKKLHGIELERSTAISLIDKTEGWITALRMISMASKNNPDIEKKLVAFKGGLYSLTEFLIEEIRSGLSDEMEDLLFSTAILKNFCFDLVKASFTKSENVTSEGTSIDELFHQLVNSDLFIVQLDDERKWFRYHHLFQRILINRLRQHFDAERIKSIRLAAAIWYEKEGSIDDAMNQLITADEDEKAAKLVIKYGHSTFLNGVGQVGIWMNKLPYAVIEGNPSLLLLKAWHAFGQFHMERIPPILEKVNRLTKDTEPEIQIGAELSFFHGNFQYWMGDTEGSIKTLSQVLSHFHQIPQHVRAVTQLVLAMAMQKNGDYDKLIPELKQKINNTKKYTPIEIGWLYGSVNFVHLLSCKLGSTLDDGLIMELLTKKIQSDFLYYWSIYLQALANLQLFQTEKALEHFEIVSKKHYIVDTRAVFDSMAAVSLIYQFNNNSAEVHRLITDAVKYARELGDPQSLTVVHSAQARIALMQGDLQKATEWANTYDEPPDFAGMFFWQEVPYLTKAKILISIGTKDSLQDAEDLLSLLYDIAAPAHLDCQLVEINLLMSIVLFKTNQLEGSKEKVKAALLQAEEQGFLRPFIEMGDLALQPIEMMKESNVCVEFIRKITNLILERDDSASKHLHKHTFAPPNINDPDKVVLTNREIETLHLLAEGLRNKEIANKIYVSEGTVKKHIYNMGQKFNTSTRVELINKARETGFIQTD